MKSVYYGKSAQVLSLGGWNWWNGEGGEGFCFIKMLNFWFLSTKHTKIYDKSIESV
jgi:hypothetical protein